MLNSTLKAPRVKAGGALYFVSTAKDEALPRLALALLEANAGVSLRFSEEADENAGQHAGAIVDGFSEEIAALAAEADEALEALLLKGPKAKRGETLLAGMAKAEDLLDAAAGYKKLLGLHFADLEEATAKATATFRRAEDIILGRRAA